jgi:ATP-dependent helicase/nuclease subunit A
VLLQGVVDCALLEDDGITILDFKTDFVTDDSLAELVERYTAQVQAYARAMSRIYGKPVKQKLLYFFHLDRFVCV